MSDNNSLHNTPGPTETRTLVETLLDQLSPTLRATLVLREVTGLEYEEIAQTLDIPVGTVRSRLNTARHQFRILWLAVQEETRNV
jgi:RNA polymerase sigma-70 factor (ECF subfamily)